MRRALAASFMSVFVSALTAFAAAPTSAADDGQTPPAPTAPVVTLRTPTTHIAPVPGCQVLHGKVPGSDWMAGVKVDMVQAKLGFSRNAHELMDDATVAAVKRWQKTHRLPMTGQVDLATWTSLGLKPTDWCVDRYQAKPRLGLTATRAQRIETAIAVARTYLTSHYVWGGAGTPRQGTDCSGLIEQSLFAAGLDVQAPDALPIYGNHQVTASGLFADPRMVHRGWAQRSRGDLVFYRGTGGSITHIGMYLGSGLMIHAWDHSHGIRISPVYGSINGAVLVREVVRPFPTAADIASWKPPAPQPTAGAPVVTPPSSPTAIPTVTPS